MQRWMKYGAGLLWCAALSAATWAAPSVARGVVYHDTNHNAVRDAGEAGVPDVRVSNGRDVVVTAADGTYELPVDGDATLFVIKPRDWMTPVGEHNLPRFYYIHRPSGSPAYKYPGVAPTGPLPTSVDFALYPQPEPERFRVLLFGDTQPATQAQVDYLAHDVVEQVIGTEAALGVTLGDLVYDKLDLFEPYVRVIAHAAVPWYNVPGNHDANHDAPDDDTSLESFQRVFGPPYYAFEYGPVHFVVLDDVLWEGQTKRKGGSYRAGLGARQLEFLRNDLKHVPRDRLVVLLMHIPIVEIEERAALYALLAERPHVISFSAHQHTVRHWFLGEHDGWPGAEPHHHVTLATACGSWWYGAPDELGIPHATMADGGPNGWYVATFEGTRHTLTFYPARRPADYQMNIYAPEEVPAAQAAQTEVLVNVFAGSERSTVEMRFDGGPWTRLERVEREDPYFAALKAAEQAECPPPGHKLPKIEKTGHMWLGHLPADARPGTRLIEVRTTDVYGQTWTGRRLVRVLPIPADQP